MKRTRSKVRCGYVSLAVAIYSACLFFAGGVARAEPETIVKKAKVVEKNGDQVDNFWKRELKYIPAAEFRDLAVAAIARASGSVAFPPVEPADATTDSPDALLVGETLLIVDPQLNNMIVSGPPEHLDLVDRLADEIDQRPRQVYIEAVIARVTLDDELKFGMDILKEGTFGKAINVRGQITNKGGSILEITDASGEPAKNGLELYTADLAKGSDGVKIISSPRVFAANDREVLISPSGEFKITVKPLINSKDEVTLQVEIKRTALVDDDPENIGTLQLSTTVRVSDGSTVVLGGIIREEDGAREELLVFLQPRIIPEGRGGIDQVPKAEPAD